ncbi:hypothetical protein R80B4_02677 [Fibrobacteres bacterium R8-0-B4]
MVFTAIFDRLSPYFAGFYPSDRAIASMIRGLREVAAIDSPVGEIYDERTRPNGLKICNLAAARSAESTRQQFF